MLKTRSFGRRSGLILGLILIGASPLSAVAETCGRWVACKNADISDVYDPKVYVYGTSRDVEPWAPTDQVAKAAPRVGATASPSSGASTAALRLNSAQDIAAETGAASGLEIIKPNFEEIEQAERAAALAEDAETDAYFANIEESINLKKKNPILVDGVTVINQYDSLLDTTKILLH